LQGAGVKGGGYAAYLEMEIVEKDILLRRISFVLYDFAATTTARI
jgi:hypothetical protein